MTLEKSSSCRKGEIQTKKKTISEFTNERNERMKMLVKSYIREFDKVEVS